MGDSEQTVRPAATVVLLRDSDEGMQVLLLRRNRDLKFAGGAWVFPGGAIDSSDAGAGGAVEVAAPQAAVREAAEECGVQLDAARLIYFAHWTTPAVGMSKRFATWFYAASVAEQTEVCIDQGEIHDFLWLTPAEALGRHAAGDLKIMPPTYLSLSLLTNFSETGAALGALQEMPPVVVEPRICKGEEGLMALYPGDAGFDDFDPQIVGPRHRCLFKGEILEYIYSGSDTGVAPMDRPQQELC